MMLVCPPKADCHRSYERMQNGGSGTGPVGLGGGTTSVSPLAKRRPAIGCTPSAVNNPSSTDADRTRNGRSPAVRFTSPVVYAPTAANDWLSSRNLKYSGGATQN